MSHGHRVWLLCEDPRTGRFLRRLCRRFQIEVLDVIVSPNGKGSASAWVIKNYAKWATRLRSKRHQVKLGLLVHVDGDNLGVASRKAQLDASLQSEMRGRRSPEEPIAIFVPTWCIETWLLHLAGIAQPLESTKLKRTGTDPSYLTAVRDLEAAEADAIRRAVAAWPGTPSIAALLPSLVDASQEAHRIGRH